MKRVFGIIAVFLVFAGVAYPQTLIKTASVAKYWLEGEKRIYRFTLDTVEIGRLEAVMKKVSTENGRRFCEIKENLSLDFSQDGKGLVFGVDGKLKVDDAGYFVSADIMVSAYDRQERIQANFSADAAVVTVARDNGEGGTRTITLPDHAYALDNYMIDQFELVLARHDLSPGKQLIVPVFSVQGIYAAEYEFAVVGKVQVQYGAFTDSVWQVDLMRPAQASIYIDRRHRIVQMIDHDQDLVAEIVIDPFAERRKPSKSLVEHINDQMIRLPVYGLYLLMAAVWLMFLGRDSYRLKWSYILFVIGGLLYPVIYITQVPLQKYYAIQVIGPAMAAGESIIFPALIPALITGLVQESLKLIPLLAAARWLKIKPLALISLGAFVGAGFGWIEACHIIAPMFQARTLTGYAFIERVFSMMFHATMGAAIGYGLARKKVWQFWLAAAGLHALANYLIVFVQLKKLTIKGLNIILAFYDMGLLSLMLLMRRSFKAFLMREKKGKR